MEHFPDGKQIGNFLDQQNKQKRPRAQKPISLGLESEKSESWILCLGNVENHMKCVHEIPVQSGSDAFPNEFVRFRVEAKPIWEEIQKHCKTTVII